MRIIMAFEVMSRLATDFAFLNKETFYFLFNKIAIDYLKLLNQ